MPRTNAQPPGRWGRTRGRKRGAGRRALLPPEGGEAASPAALGCAPGPGGARGQAAGPPSSKDSSPPPAPPPARSRTSLEPVPYTAKRGEGQGPPDTAALRHEPPPPARDPDPGQGRGAHFLYLAGLDPILSRGGLQSPHPHPIHLPRPVGSGLGSPSLCSFRLRPTLCRLCLLSLAFPISLSPVVSSPSHISSSLPISPDYLFPLHTLPGRSHRKDQTLPYPFQFPQINPHMNKVQNQILPSLPEPGPSAAAELKFFLCLRPLWLTSVCLCVLGGMCVCDLN